MRLSLPSLAIAASACAVAFDASAHEPRRYRDAVLVCESDRGQPRQCAADIQGKVKLLRQFSRSECVEGRTWGAMRGGIWVSDGCRGEFLVQRRRPAATAQPPRHVRCESVEGRSKQCPAHTRHGVELVRQLSSSPCIRDRNWGWTRRGVWVTGGCRAEFRSITVDPALRAARED